MIKKINFKDLEGLLVYMVLMTAAVFLVSCNMLEVTYDFETDKDLAWISYDRDLPEQDSLFYLDQQAPIFRKTFHCSKQLDSAALYITAAGYYKSFINGKDIGDIELDPAWTDYSKRVYYSVFDLSNEIIKGDNCLAVSLGNGFYNPLPLRKWGHRNLRNDLKVGKPAFIASIMMYYSDGSREKIVSDETWKFTYGPLLKNSVYLGVSYDARKEIEGWKRAETSDDDWHNAVIENGPGGQLQKAFFPGVCINKEIIPENIYKLSDGKTIVDMGVNFTGSYAIKIKGERGDSIRFRFGERLYEDGTLNPMTSVIGQIKRKGVGGPGAPEIAWQSDLYIVGNQEISWFKPDFTYHTYRYMEIDGLSEMPAKEDVRGLFVYSDVSDQNSFTCSSELINDIQDMVDRTFKANLVSVQSDCPAREKFGYGGDLNATSEAFIYNLDMHGFYKKTIYDWLDAMNDSTFVDTAPFTGIAYCGLSWESAFLITQYYLWLYYGDTELIEELYQKDLEWMRKAQRIHPDGLVDKGLGDHESLSPVPVELTGTCHYLHCARIMKIFAELMNDPEHTDRFAELEEKLKTIIYKKFWISEVPKKINKQTLFAHLLNYDVLENEDKVLATDSLIYYTQTAPSGHFTTGIFGTKSILSALSEYVSPDYVYQIIHSKEYPGWGYMIDRGATTVWETWKESDNTFSNCHPMFGSVSEWFYKFPAGIRPDPKSPGFKAFSIRPSLIDDLNYVNCEYYSPFGKIVSNWKKTDTHYQFDLEIPKGTLCKFSVPTKKIQKLKYLKIESDGCIGDTLLIDKDELELKDGLYRIFTY